MRKLYRLREQNKEIKKGMKKAEDAALHEALVALDGLELRAGAIGPATFEASIVRKLRLKVSEQPGREEKDEG